MRNTFLQDKAAVVGVGNTSFGALYRNLDPDRSQYDLGAEAFVAALEDSGLRKDEIDGVLVCRIPDYGRMSDILGIRYPQLRQRDAGGRPHGQHHAAVRSDGGRNRPGQGRRVHLRQQRSLRRRRDTVAAKAAAMRSASAMRHMA